MDEQPSQLAETKLPLSDRMKATAGLVGEELAGKPFGDRCLLIEGIPADDCLQAGEEAARVANQQFQGENGQAACQAVEGEELLMRAGELGEDFSFAPFPVDGKVIEPEARLVVNGSRLDEEGFWQLVTLLSQMRLQGSAVLCLRLPPIPSSCLTVISVGNLVHLAVTQGKVGLAEYQADLRPAIEEAEAAIAMAKETLESPPPKGEGWKIPMARLDREAGLEKLARLVPIYLAPGEIARTAEETHQPTRAVRNDQGGKVTKFKKGPKLQIPVMKERPHPRSSFERRLT